MSVKRRRKINEAEARNVMDEVFRVALTRDISGELDCADLVVTRKDIEALRTGPLLNALYRLLATKQTIMSFRQKLRIQLSGYSAEDGDPRNIEKVRQYFASLDEDFPYWFFFFQPSDAGLGTITSFLCPCEVVSDEFMRIAPNDLRPFLQKHFEAMVFIFETYQLPDSTGDLRGGMALSVLEFFGIHPDVSMNKES